MVLFLSKICRALYFLGRFLKIRFLMIAVVLFARNDCNGMKSVDDTILLIGQQNKAIAHAYYTAMAEKNIVALEKYLDDHVVFIAPLATVIGKEAFLERVEEFFA